MSLETVARLAGGTLAAGAGSAEVTSVSTNSRQLPDRCLFVALVGERFDAHDFLADVATSGAGGALVSSLPDGFVAPEGFGIVRVADTLAGLQALAAGYRGLLDAKVVGITGSSGKTSTKDMILSVLGAAMPARGTLGNLNNHIGLPLTVLSMESGDRAGVWEMGMNHAGEIAPLAAIARPDIGVVTNVGTAHIEFLGTREAIAEEKGALIEALEADGCAILPSGDDFVDDLAGRCKGTVVRAGIGSGDVVADGLEFGDGGTKFQLRLTGGETATVDLPVPGRHMVANATLAAAVGERFGLGAETIARGLADLVITGGRLEAKAIAGIRFLDDTYNANPDSMLAGLQALREVPSTGRRIAVFGRMGELGEHAGREHGRIGEAARTGACSADLLVTVGDGAEAYGGDNHFADAAGCAAFLKSSVAEGDVVLVKGSRAARTEQVIEAFSNL